MTDLCVTCQRNSAAIIRSANMTEQEKSEVCAWLHKILQHACILWLTTYIIVITMQTLKEAEAHLLRATCERSYYRGAVKSCHDQVHQKYTTGGTFCPPAPGSGVLLGDLECAHYSFDFAQQVHYPHNPLQAGPMYFRTARKCAIFGVCCEGIPRQINYLIDEAFDTGKGPNTVVSLLHHFLANHSLGELSLHLHADNCSGQNKNNVVMQVNLPKVYQFPYTKESNTMYCTTSLHTFKPSAHAQH